MAIPVILKQEGVISSSCGDTRDKIAIQIFPDKPPVGDGIVHFAIPAKDFWADIGYT